MEEKMEASAYFINALILESQKAKVFMVVIEKIVELYQNEYLGKACKEEIFKLFEKAKAIKRAENEADFQSAIADL